MKLGKGPEEIATLPPVARNDNVTAFNGFVLNFMKGGLGED
jgi:hypothetical protein